MHAYDPVRHTWRYDIGGFAWDNTELASNMWLWYNFLRTGRADIWRMAEAMTRHTAEDKKTLKKELKKTDIDSPLLAYDDYLQYVVYNSYKINYKDKDIKKIVQEVVNKALEERKTERGEA